MDFIGNGRRQRRELLGEHPERLYYTKSNEIGGISKDAE
jgi:hypothetical protein